MNRYIGKKVKSDASIILSHISLQLGYTHESNGFCKTNKNISSIFNKKSLMIKSYLYKSAYTISFKMVENCWLIFLVKYVFIFSNQGF